MTSSSIVVINFETVSRYSSKSSFDPELWTLINEEFNPAAILSINSDSSRPSSAPTELNLILESLIGMGSSLKPMVCSQLPPISRSRT